MIHAFFFAHSSIFFFFFSFSVRHRPYGLPISETELLTVLILSTPTTQPRKFDLVWLRFFEAIPTVIEQ